MFHSPTDGRTDSAPGQSNPRTPLRSSVLLKWATFVALIVVFTAGVFSLVSYTFARRTLRHQIHDRLTVVAASRQARIQDYVAQQQERVALVASRTRLRQLVEQFQQGETDLESFRQGSRRILIDARNSTEGFLAIWIADPVGQVITATEDRYLEMDFLDDKDFREGAVRTHLGAPQLIDGIYCAYLTGPAHTDSGELLGVVMVLLDVTSLARLLNDATGLGDTGEVIVGARMGEELHFLLPPRHGGGQSVAWSRAPLFAKALSGEAAFGTTDYLGREVLAAWRPVSFQPPEFRRWGMVVTIDASEAYAPVAQLRRTMFGLLAALLVVGTVLSFVVARQFTRPILALAETSTAVAAGDLTARAPVKSSDEIGALATAFNDMTEKLADTYATLEDRVRERTDELRQANAALERSNQDLDDFAYISSHDLKEPLRGISAYSHFLLEDYKDRLDEDGQEKLQTLIRLCKRLEDLIDSLLHYSRVGRAELAFRETDLGEVVREVLDSIHVTLQQENVDVRIPQPMPTIVCDSVRVRELYRNLITNAMKYNDKPQKWIEVGHRQEPAKDEAGNGTLVFYFRDNGIGIREKHLDSVFRIFRRLHGRDAYGGGTGAGLTFAKKIVERHGGRIWVESVPDQGSCFFFTLG